MSPLNHKRTTRSLVPPIFYVVKNLQLKDRRFPIDRVEAALSYHFRTSHFLGSPLKYDLFSVPIGSEECF